MIRRRAGALAALGCGLAAALAHPPFGLIVGLLGFGGLWLLLEQATTVRSAAWRGWLCGFGYFGVGCWWVAEAFLVDAEAHAWMAPFAAALLPAGLALFWAAAAALHRRLAAGRGPASLRALAFAGLLAGAEWLRGHVLTGFPWNLPGEAFRAGSGPSQLAALVGPYGLSWLVLALAAAAVSGVLAPRRRWLAPLIAAILAAALYGYGAHRLQALDAAAEPQPGAPLMRIVQADVPQEAKWTPERFAGIVARYVRLTAAPGLGGRRPDAVLWPESALPAAANDWLAPGAWTRTAVAEALGPGQVLLTGGYRVSGAPGAERYYNSLLVLRRNAADLSLQGVYDKHRLVPFGEYLPLGEALAAFGLRALVHAPDDFTAGAPPRPLAVPGLPTVQPLICYESLFPRIDRGGRAASAWLANVSNDAWFGRTSGPRQHLNLASYRAIESGRPLLRATPTGVSAVVDALGRTRSALEPGVEGVIDSPLPAALPAPPYARWGDAFYLAMMLGSLACLAVLWSGQPPRSPDRCAPLTPRSEADVGRRHDKGPE